MNGRMLLRFVVVAYMLVVFATLVMDAQQRAAAPHNEIVIMVDGSLSFVKRHEEAIDKTMALVQDLEQRKGTVWQEDTDSLAIISLDAIPNVVWRGSPTSLRKSKNDGTWSKWLAARADYAGCTDVLAGFNLAIQQFSEAAVDTRKYLIVFSDLISEPPLSTVKHCAKPQTAPPQNMPWTELQDVNVSAFWVPANSALIWHRSIEHEGLSRTFHVYSDSEAGAIAIPPPPRVEHETTEKERSDARERVGSVFGSFMKFIFVAAIALIAGVILVLVLAQRSARHQPSRPEGRVVNSRITQGRPR